MAYPRSELSGSDLLYVAAVAFGVVVGSKMADRFITWLYYARGLRAHEAQAWVRVEVRNALLSEWIALGCPYPVGV